MVRARTDTLTRTTDFACLLSSVISTQVTNYHLQSCQTRAMLEFGESRQGVVELTGLSATQIGQLQQQHG